MKKHTNLGLLTISFFLSLAAEAGVFTLPRFVPEGKGMIGLEPELTLTNGAGIGINAKGSYGLGTLSNIGFAVGTGTGPRQFRFGVYTVFDFFPDVDNQPGIGLAAQLFYYSLKYSSIGEATLIPYIHKAFVSGDNTFDPFLAVPFGTIFSGRSFTTFYQVAVGSQFLPTETFAYIVEFCISVHRGQTYFAGGIAYYFL